MTEYNAFRVELADKIAHVQINRPDKINAMNQDFWREIIEIFRWVDDTDEVRVVVLSGAGKHFSSGIDLMLLAQVGSQLGKDVGRNADALRRKILELQASFNAVDNCRKPVLAAIQGYCLGGAIDLVSACDMRYSTADAQFSIKEIDIGMAADVGTLQRLPRIIGDGMMREPGLHRAHGRRRRGTEHRPGQSYLRGPGRIDGWGLRTGAADRREVADRHPWYQGNDPLYARPPGRRRPRVRRYLERRHAPVRRPAGGDGRAYGQAEAGIR